MRLNENPFFILQISIFSYCTIVHLNVYTIHKVDVYPNISMYKVDLSEWPLSPSSLLVWSKTYSTFSLLLSNIIDTLTLLYKTKSEILRKKIILLYCKIQNTHFMGRFSFLVISLKYLISIQILTCLSLFSHNEMMTKLEFKTFETF